MSEKQSVIYALLCEVFRQFRVSPADAIPVMRKLADDAEKFSQLNQVTLQTPTSVN